MIEALWWVVCVLAVQVVRVEQKLADMLMRVALAPGLGCVITCQWIVRTSFHPVALTAIMPLHRLARLVFDVARACRGVVGSF